MKSFIILNFLEKRKTITVPTIRHIELLSQDIEGDTFGEEESAVSSRPRTSIFIGSSRRQFHELLPHRRIRPTRFAVIFFLLLKEKQIKHK